MININWHSPLKRVVQDKVEQFEVSFVEVFLSATLYNIHFWLLFFELKKWRMTYEKKCVNWNRMRIYILVVKTALCSMVRVLIYTLQNCSKKSTSIKFGITLFTSLTREAIGVIQSPNDLLSKKCLSFTYQSYYRRLT